jgi:hypothetical protein
MKKFILPLLVLIFTAALLTTCSKEKTERALYEEMTSGFTYKTYKLASQTTVPPAVATYNSQLPDSISPIGNDYAHLLLGYGWTVSSKPAMAFAEADIAEESSSEEVKFLARSLRSIAMYQQGWDTLAQEESRRANVQAPHASSSNVQTEATIFYLLLGLAEAHEKDFAQSKFYFAGFANQTGIHWPYKIADAADDLHSGRTQQGLIKVKAISQDPAVPESLRNALGEKIALIESEAGDINSKLFWPKLISAVVMEEMKKSNNEQIGKLVRLLESIREKLPA